MNRLQEIEARLAAIANEIEQRGAELTAEQLTAFETEVNNLKTERAGLMAAAEQPSEFHCGGQKRRRGCPHLPFPLFPRRR